jgi:hypothetical protein
VAAQTVTGYEHRVLLIKWQWEIDLKIGQNKKAGDFSAYLGLSPGVGIAATDPNLSTSDMMNARLNFQGFDFGVIYSLTDFLPIGADGVIDWNLSSLYGGQATRGSGIAADNTGTISASSQS